MRKTLADLKRAVQTGVTVEVVNHRHPELSGRRTFGKIQTNGWYLSLPVGHPKAADNPKGSWITMPKAVDVQWTDDDTVAISSDGILMFTLTFAIDRPDITDRHGRVWVWKSGSLYTHDDTLTIPESFIHDERVGLPSPNLAGNPAYAKLCDICRSQWPTGS